MKTTNGIPIVIVVFFPPVVSFQALENSKAWASQEHDKLVNKLKMAIQEKDKTIGVRTSNHQAWDFLRSIFCVVVPMTMPLSYSNKFSCFIFLPRD